MTSRAEKLFDEVDSLQVQLRGLREQRNDLIEQQRRINFEIGHVRLLLQAKHDEFQRAIESDAARHSGADAVPRSLPTSGAVGGSFTLHALTDKGREKLPEIEAMLAPLLGKLQ